MFLTLCCWPDAQETKAAHEALVGALRREEAARRDTKRLQEELAGLKDLLDQKEQDVQRTRMIIRLKDARLEVLLRLPMDLAGSDMSCRSLKLLDQRAREGMSAGHFIGQPQMVTSTCHRQIGL